MATKLHEVALGATPQAPVGTSETSLSTELGQPVVPFYLAVSFSQSVRLSGWLSLTSLNSQTPNASGMRVPSALPHTCPIPQHPHPTLPGLAPTPTPLSTSTCQVSENGSEWEWE